jgi:hypothetical protein
MTNSRKRAPLVKILFFWVISCQLQAASLDAFQVGPVSIGRQALSNNNDSNNSKDNNNQGVHFHKLGTQAHTTSKSSQNDASVVKRAAAVRVESEGTNTTPSNIRTLLRWPLVGATTILMAGWIPGVNLITAYTKSMTLYPLPTKMATGALLATVGDALAQLRETKASYDSFRAASFMCFDAAYRVFQHNAFPFIIGNCQGQFLGRIFPLSSKWTHFLAVTERTLTYQLLVVPLFYYPIFFTFTGFMQGLNWQATLQRGAQLFFPCWKRNLLFWIPTQYFMFGLVATEWQIPFVCVMGILWSTILSVTAGNAKSTPKSE